MQSQRSTEMTTAATVDLGAMAGHDAASFPKIDPNNHVVMLDNCEHRVRTGVDGTLTHSCTPTPAAPQMTGQPRLSPLPDRVLTLLGIEHRRL